MCNRPAILTSLKKGLTPAFPKIAGRSLSILSKPLLSRRMALKSPAGFCHRLPSDGPSSGRRLPPPLFQQFCRSSKSHRSRHPHILVAYSIHLRKFMDSYCIHSRQMIVFSEQVCVPQMGYVARSSSAMRSRRRSSRARGCPAPAGTRFQRAVRQRFSAPSRLRSCVRTGLEWLFRCTAQIGPSIHER